MAKQRFFQCQHCGNLVGLILDEGPALVCCGDSMKELVPNTVEASAEKHIPAVTATADAMAVQVGSVEHPMTQEHHITFIYVETENGGQRKSLAVDAAPKADFAFKDDKPAAVYAFCNLHGLWKVDL